MTILRRAVPLEYSYQNLKEVGSVENRKRRIRDKIQAALSRRFSLKGIITGSRFIDKRRLYLVTVWWHLPFKMGTTITHLCVGGYDPREKKFLSSEKEGAVSGARAFNKQEGMGYRAEGEEGNLYRSRTVHP